MLILIGTNAYKLQASLSERVVVDGHGCHGLQSKRPQVKTSPSQNVPELVKTSQKIGQIVPMVENVGQNTDVYYLDMKLQ